MDQADQVNEVSAQLHEMLKEAARTYGMSVTFTALTLTAAGFVHQAELQMPGQPMAREIALGIWAEGFARVLTAINAAADANAT